MSVEQPLRILHLTSYSLYSGPLPPALGLALAQRKLGHTVWLAYDKKRGAFNEFEEPAAPRVDGLGLEPPINLTLSAKSSPVEFFNDVRTLRAFVRAGNVDLIHVHLSHDHTLSTLARAHKSAKCVRTFHAARSIKPRLGQRWLNHKVHGWIVRCKQHQKELLHLMGNTNTPISVIPGGIDSTEFKPADSEARLNARCQFDIPTQAKVIAHVALIQNRGQEELVGAMARVNSPNLHVLFVGRGLNEHALKLLIQGAGLEGKAHFSGYLLGPELNKAYAAADAAFLARPGNDGSARAALEAMSCSLPVIGVENEALKELVTKDVGYPAAECSPEEIAHSLKNWLTDQKSVQRGQAARKYIVEKRSFTEEAKKTIQLYQQLIAKN